MFPKEDLSRRMLTKEDLLTVLPDLYARFSEVQLAMLQAHYEAPGHTRTATELAHAAGYPSYSTTNSQYGGLAHLICDACDVKNHQMTNGFNSSPMSGNTGMNTVNSSCDLP